jgi:hypothetical protein
LIPNPIRKVLSSMHKHRVRALLMGEQACVLYGAAEFSRDTDFAIVADAANLARLRRVLKELRAEVIATPPLDLKHLRHGHAVHFRCHEQGAFRMRVDLMSKMRGVAPFSKLWKRRTTIALTKGLRCDVLSVADLVQAKKTQRDKDWPMIRRLVEAHYFQNRDEPARSQVCFWLLDLRTPELLIDVARSYAPLARKFRARRPLLARAEVADSEALERELIEEEMAERARDKAYWMPLRKELEQLRHARQKARTKEGTRRASRR